MAEFNKGYTRDGFDEEQNVDRGNGNRREPSAIIKKEAKEKYSDIEEKLLFQRKLSLASVCTAVVAILALFIYIGWNTVAQSNLEAQLEVLKMETKVDVGFLNNAVNELKDCCHDLTTTVKMMKKNVNNELEPKVKTL